MTGYVSHADIYKIESLWIYGKFINSKGVNGIIGEVRSPYDGNKLSISYTPAERMLRGLGFLPIRESIERDQYYITQSEKIVIS